MNKQKTKTVANTRPKFNVSTVIAVFLLVVLSINRTKSDEMCDAIVVDSITQLENGSIVIFRNNDVWLLDQKQKELVGPCPIGNIFKDMSGPIDAAFTISNHDAITDFIGSGVYFESKNFFTYKNLGQYNVEWGSLVYLPHKGAQTEMGESDPKAQEYMKQVISYAYFDPIASKSKFVFSDGTVLTFTFDMGAKFDVPTVSTIVEELTKYGADKIPKTLSAAIALTEDKVTQLFLFNGSTFCSIKLSPKSEAQKCQLKPVKEFLNCNSLKRRNDVCMTSSVADSHETPIEAKDSAKSESSDNEANPKSENKVKVRSENQTATIESDKPTEGGCPQSLTKNTFVFILIFIVFQLL